MRDRRAISLFMLAQSLLHLVEEFTRYNGGEAHALRARVAPAPGRLWQRSLPRGQSLGSNGVAESLLNPPPGLSGRRAVRQSIHAALAPSLLPLSAFHAASSMPVVKQRVWRNSPPLVRYTLELIITYLIDPSFARSRAG